MRPESSMRPQKEMLSFDGKMSFRELLTKGEALLRETGIADAKQDAWYLLSHVADMKREAYYLRMEEPVEAEISRRYRGLLEKRASHVPLQYLTGKAPFMGLEFMVNEHVLIPRFDTETLVEEAAGVIRAGDRVLDLCTGSGCILLSLCERCPIDGVGADISAEALKVAEENGKRLGLTAAWVQSDLFEKITGKFHVIVSNPPYIPTAALEELMPEVRLFEPKSALDGSGDGLYFYRRIAARASEYLLEGGKVLFEIGYDQAEDVTKILKRAGFLDICVKKDLCGKDRVVSARLGE